MHGRSVARDSVLSSRQGLLASRSPGSCRPSHSCPPGRALAARRGASSTNIPSIPASPARSSGAWDVRLREAEAKFGDGG
eukprot:scaffold22465_cov60-Phaeocystis_antarctica.AAC.2